MQRIELQVSNFKYAANNNTNFVSEEVANLLFDHIEPKSLVAELRGVGMASEFVSSIPAKEVDLYEENKAVKKVRDAVAPNSAVMCIPVDPSRLQFSSPPYDWVIINKTSDMEYAEMLASKGIINLENKSVTEVEKNAKSSSKSKRRTKSTDNESESVSEVVEDSPVVESDTAESTPVQPDPVETPDGHEGGDDASTESVEPVE